MDTSSLTPGSVSTYLVRSGWWLDRADPYTLTYRKRINGGKFSVSIPRKTAIADYPNEVSKLLHKISSIQRVTVEELLQDFCLQERLYVLRSTGA